MRLVWLKIIKSTDNSVIRDIRFNESGLSLVVDKDSKAGESGNNLGKTTFVKLIDLVLGGSDIKIVYTGKDKSVNVDLKSFIEQNQVYAELKIEKINGESILLRRDLFERGKCYIHEKTCKGIKAYNAELKNLFFAEAAYEKVTFRQLIPFFIRYDERLSTIFKYLGNMTNTDQYIRCYRALLSLAKRDDIDLGQVIKEKEDENKSILKRTKVSSILELEGKISEKKVALEKLSAELKSNEVVEGFSKESDHAIQEKRIDELSSDVSQIELEISVFESKIENEKLSLSPIDKEALSMLYGEVSSLLSLKVNFEELAEFHEKMVYSRIDRYKAKLDALKNRLQEKKAELQAARKEYADQFVDFKYSLNEVANSSFDEVVDLKAELTSLEKAKNKYLGNVEAINNAKESLKQISVQNGDDERKQKIVREFFRTSSKKLLEDENNLEFTNAGFPLKLQAEDNGDGNIKILIACFAYSLNHLYETLNFDRPSFLVEDAMENASLRHLKDLIEFSKGQKMQLIIPILYDRIQGLGIDDKDIVLHLSQKDKLFGI